MAGLWRNDPDIKGPKFLVQRRDGTVPDWPWFVLGGRDPAAPAGLRAYADKAAELNFDPQYVADVRELADVFEAHREETGSGDPDAGRHRQDNPEIVEKMEWHSER